MKKYYLSFFYSSCRQLLFFLIFSLIFNIFLMCYIGGLLHDVLAVEEIVGYAIIMGSKRHNLLGLSF